MHTFFLFVLDYLGSVSKESTWKAGDAGSILRWGRSLGGGDGNPLQYPYLENSMDRGAWQATVHGVARLGHDLASKPPPDCLFLYFAHFKIRIAVFFCLI